MYNGLKNCPSPEALGYFLALLPVSTTRNSYCRLLNECSIDDSGVSIRGPSDSEEEELGIPRVTDVALGIHDANTALLVASFAGTILATAQGDDAETQMLYGLLSSLANSYPEIISITYDTMHDRIKDTFANSSNAAIIRSVSNIFRVALQDASKSSNNSAHYSSTSTLSTVDENSIGPGRSHLNALEELAMQGLANNLTFLPPNRGHATKMINWIPTLVSLMISS
jgi:neurofibromin 1